MASIPMLPASATAKDVVACLENAGCVVVRDVTDNATREKLKRELAPHMETSDAGNRLNKVYEALGGNGSFYPGNTTRITALVAKSEVFRSFVMHPLMLSACDALLKPNCASYQVHATAGLVVGPGATVQVLHREEDGFQFFKLPRPNMVLASMWAISDFTEANGGTHLVPGSHRWEAGRVARDDEVVAAEMPAGSVLLWMGGTLHGAGANRTEEERRYGIFLSYSLGWLRQEENQYLDTPPEIARTFPKPLRRIIGYGMHTSLGYTDVPPNEPAEKQA
jgi:ectoine hydroxylase-related dioxygenase (phytanoyl-CoA dioxygenase family)